LSTLDSNGRNNADEDALKYLITLMENIDQYLKTKAILDAQELSYEYEGSGAGYVKNSTVFKCRLCS